MTAQLTATPEGREYLRSNGYKSGQPVIAAGYTELIKDVLPRITSKVPPVTIALVNGDELCLFSIKPSRSLDESPVSNASPESTIGMLYEAGQQSHGKTFRISDWADATAVAMPSASALVGAK